MEAVLLLGSILLFFVVKNHVDTLENTSRFKNATPEEQKKMIEKRDKEVQEKRDRATNRHYDHNYNDEDSSSTIHNSSSSSSYDDSYTNPSSGLPMTTSGTGGVDTSGKPYGM